MYSIVDGYYNGTAVVLDSYSMLKTGQFVKVLFETPRSARHLEKNADAFIKSLSLKGKKIPSDVSSMEVMAFEKYL